MSSSLHSTGYYCVPPARPFDRFLLRTAYTMHTTRTDTDVRDLLNTHVHGERTYPVAGRAARTYLGFVFGETFEMRGPLGNKRFTLFTEGTIMHDPDGMRLHVTMRLGMCNLMANIFIFVTFFLVIGIFLPLLFIVFALMGFALMYTLTLATMHDESAIIAKILYNILATTSEQPHPPSTM